MLLVVLNVGKNQSQHFQEIIRRTGISTLNHGTTMLGYYVKQTPESPFSSHHVRYFDAIKRKG